MEATATQEHQVDPPLLPEPEQPTQSGPDLPPAGSSKPIDQEPQVAEVDGYPDDGYPDFESLDGAFEGTAPDAPDAPEPFTGEEIASGAAMALMMGLQVANDEERAAFEKAFAQAVPFMPTPYILDALKVGDALAAYGIHKGMLGGPDALASLPAWLRLLLGVASLGLAGINAARAVMEVRRGAKQESVDMGAGARGSGPAPVPEG